VGDALKRIEEKHSPAIEDDDVCRDCMAVIPCDVVKLARALVGLMDGLDDYWITLPEGKAAKEQAERTLEEVAGG
jgi:hypothetical protein